MKTRFFLIASLLFSFVINANAMDRAVHLLDDLVETLSFSEPTDEIYKNYRDISSEQCSINSNATSKKWGRAKLSNGSIVQGSATRHGQMPDMVIDLDSKITSKFIEQCEDLQNLEPAGIINEAQNLVTSSVNKPKYKGVKGYDYNHPHWKETAILRYIGKNKGMPISVNLDKHFSDCRGTNALYTICLNAAGIQAEYGYFKVTVGDNDDAADHAMVVYKVKDREYILDAYNPNFHGLPMDSLFAGIDGSDVRSERLDGIELHNVKEKMNGLYDHSRKITEKNQYPIILNFN